MMSKIKQEINKILESCDVQGEVELVAPPNSEMGDLSFSCFGIAKEKKKNPTEVAKDLESKVQSTSTTGRQVKSKIIERVEAVGPYVNFYLNSGEVARLVMEKIKKENSNYGVSQLGNRQKVMVEFAHPNTHKAFHIGHLRNIITGESMVRILENFGYEVVRANYQGDVGMHIAKCLWGIEQLKDEYEEVKKEDLDIKVKFLGKAYALGGQNYETSEQVKKEVAEYNKNIYNQDSSIQEVYRTTRTWSLEYFDKIYKRVGSNFDRLYFESETFKRGKEIVLGLIKNGIFKESQGAIIFEGSKYNLHDRVFINSEGNTTYEAKDMALAELQFKEYHPEVIYHLVAKEQTEYFRVIFKALEFVLPESKDKEQHLIYGWVRLKEGKMSSRTGQVVLGEWLLDEAEKKIAEIIKDRELKDKKEIIRKVGIASVKYSMLKTGISNDIVFDFNESVSLEGDSGPYLLYICARIKSILRKNNNQIPELQFPEIIDKTEKKLILKLADFLEVTSVATELKDPSKIGKYLFELAKDFNNFYHACPVLTAEKDLQNFRLNLIKDVELVMERGLYLLGIETVEEM